MAKAKLTAFVGLNTTSFQRGLRNMRRRWHMFKSTVMAPMMQFGRMVGRVFMRAGLAVGIALVGAIKHANEFRKQMSLVNTMLNGEDLSQFTDAIIKMSGKFGEAKSSLTKGLYDILSAGIAAKDGLNVLKVATRAAIGGATDTAVSVDALTTVINAYGLASGASAQEIEQTATHVSDVLFQIVKDGKITYAELAENIGKIAPTAKAAGLQIEELGALIATIVKTEKPERAMTSLRQAMFKAAEDGQNLFELAKRFKGASLGDIIAAGINKKIAAGVVILANNYDTLIGEVEKFKHVQGQSQKAFDKMKGVRHWARLWQTVLGLATRFGMVLDKTLAPLINQITDSLATIGDSAGFKKFLADVQSAVTTLSGAMVALARGGPARDMALKGFKIVLIESFAIAARKASSLLLAVAPKIGALIGAGAMSMIKTPAKAIAERFTAGSLARENVNAGTAQDVGTERERILSEWRTEDLKESIAEIEKMFGIELPDSANKLQEGFDLLKAAASAATKDLEAFQEEVIDTGPTVSIGSGGDGAVTAPGQGVAGSTQFSSLRRIGANILTGAGAGVKIDLAARARAAQLKELVDINTWIKKGVAATEKQTAAFKENTGGAIF